MKRIAIAVLAGFVVLSAAIVYSQLEQKPAYIKPEIRDAITVTPEMLAPMRLAPGEYWFSAVIDDPRSGRFNGGYLTYKFSTNNNGLQVISTRNVLKLKAYNMTAAETDSSTEDIFSPAYGRILHERVKGNFSVMLNPSSPPSTGQKNKTAEFDWDDKVIRITFENDPKAPIREHPMEENTTTFMSIMIFMLKGKWTDTSKVYRFHYFDIDTEKI